MSSPSHDIGYLLTAYAEGTLNDEGRQWVEAQLALHPQLHESLEAIRQVRQALQGTLPAAPTALESLRRTRLLEYAQQHQGPPARRWRKYALFTAAAAMVAGVALFLGIPGTNLNPRIIEELGKQTGTPASAAEPSTFQDISHVDATAPTSQVVAANDRTWRSRLLSAKESTTPSSSQFMSIGPAGGIGYDADTPQRSELSNELKPTNANKDMAKSDTASKGVDAESLDRLEQAAVPQDFQKNEEPSPEQQSSQPSQLATMDAYDEEDRKDQPPKVPHHKQRRESEAAQNAQTIPAAPFVADELMTGGVPAPAATPAPDAPTTPANAPAELGGEQVAANDLRAVVIEERQALARKSQKTAPSDASMLDDAKKALQEMTSEDAERLLSGKSPSGNVAGTQTTSVGQAALLNSGGASHGDSAATPSGHKMASPDEVAPASILMLKPVDVASISPQQVLAQLQGRHSFWTTDRQALQTLRSASDGAAAQCIDGLVVANPYHVHDLSYAQVLLAAARRHQLQLRIDGGAVSLHAHAIPLDPTALYGWDAADFRSAFDTAPMQAVAQSPTLTFALSSDTASFQQAQASLASGRMPDPTSIQSEQFINAMPLEYPPAQGPGTFMLYAEAGPSPFAAGPERARTALVSVGVVTRSPAADERRPLHLTVAVDCSGSMGRPGALDRVQTTLHEMVAHLHADDQVCLVRFSDAAEVALPPTPGDQGARINQAIADLHSGGATNGAEGLALAYQLAAEDDLPAADHRVLFATDGASLSGPRAQQLLERVAGYQARGIALMVVGCGSDDQQQRALQLLADHAHGQHVYLGSDEQAISLAQGPLLPEHLQVLARDAKVQVTWNAERVSHVRLIGYENRRLANREFRNDDVVAGQLAHDVQVTALFEVQLLEGAAGPLGDASVRCYDTRYQAVREQHFPLPGSLMNAVDSPRLQLCACAAQLAELLQHGWWSNVRLCTWDALEQSLQALPPSPSSATLQRMCEEANALEPSP